MIQFDRKHQEIILPVSLVNMICKIAKEGHHQIYNFQHCLCADRPGLSRANKKMRNIFLSRGSLIDLYTFNAFDKVHQLFITVISRIEIRLLF